MELISGGSRGEDRDVRPAHLFWVKKKKWQMGEKPSGQVNKNHPHTPPPPLLKVRICHWHCSGKEPWLHPPRQSSWGGTIPNIFTDSIVPEATYHHWIKWPGSWLMCRCRNWALTAFTSSSVIEPFFSSSFEATLSAMATISFAWWNSEKKSNISDCIKRVLENVYRRLQQWK